MFPEVMAHEALSKAVYETLSSFCPTVAAVKSKNRTHRIFMMDVQKKSVRHTTDCLMLGCSCW
jgi:hypothetical protein